MTSNLELKGEIFPIFKGLKKNRSTAKQQNIENPLGRARKPNFISKHIVMLNCSQICYLRYAKVCQVTMQPDLLSKICRSIPATPIIGLKRFFNSN